MKKTFNKATKATFAAVLATSVLVPVAAQAAENTQSLEGMVLKTTDNTLAKLPIEEYKEALLLGLIKPADITHVVGNNGKTYSYEDYKEALLLGTTLEKAFEILDKNNLEDTESKIVDGEIKDGKLVGNDGTSSKVTSVKAINTTGKFVVGQEATLPETVDVTVVYSDDTDEVVEGLAVTWDGEISTEEATTEAVTITGTVTFEEVEYEVTYTYTVAADEEALAKEAALEALATAVTEGQSAVDAAVTALEAAVTALEDIALTEESTEQDIADAETLVAAATEAQEAVTTAITAANTAINEAAANEALVDATEEELATAGALDTEAADAAVEAAATAIAAAEAAIAEATVGQVVVESVSANNETTVGLVLPEDFEGELEGKTITVTGEEGTLTATYSATVDGVAHFVLDEEAELVDATTYTVSANWATFENAEFVAKVAAEYVAEVEKVTQEVTASTANEDDGKHVTNITVKTKNQYGEDFTSDKVSAKGTLNGMPLTDSEISYDAGKVKVKVNTELKVGQTLEFTLVTKDDAGKEIGASAPVTYEVIKGETKVPTTIDGVTATDKDGKAIEGNLIPQDVVTLTADIKDQYGNPVTKAEDGKKLVRWVVTEGKDLITGDFEDTAENTVKFTASQPGTVTIEAYNLANGAKATYTVDIDASPLTAITVKNSLKDANDKELVNATPYNNEEGIVAVLSADPSGAKLSAEDIDFDIETSEGLTEDDITVTAEEITVGTGEDAKKHIVVKATTTKAGTYTVTPFVGEAIDAEKVAKGTAITVETNINPEVAEISDFTFDAKALKVGATNVQAEVVFKNKHGEVLTAAQANADLTSSNGTVTGAVTVVQGTEDNAAKTYVNLAALKAGTSLVTVQVGSLIKTVQVTVAEAVLTKIDAGKNVTGVVAGDTEDKAKYNVVQFLDQDGVAVDGKDATLTVVKTGDKENTSVENLAGLVTGTLDKDGKFVADTEGAEPNGDVYAVKVLPKATVEAGTYTVTVAKEVTIDGKKETVKGTFDVTVGAARAAKTVEVTAKTPAITVGGTTELTIVPKDQYGEFIEVNTSGDTAPVFQIVGDDFVGGEFTPITEDKKDEKTVAYKVTAKGLKAGSGTVKVNVLGAKGTDGKQPVLATASQTITVDSVGKLVDTVEITETELQNTSGDGDAEVKLEAIGKDAAGNDVAINANDLTWSIKSVKDAKGEALTLTGDVTSGATLKNSKGEFLVAGGEYEAEATNAVKVTLANGVLTGSTGLTVEVEVQVKTANNKLATSVVKFDGEGSKYVSGLAVYDAVFIAPDLDNNKTVAAKDLTDGGLKISFTKDQVDATDGTIKDIELTFTGVDQYGKPMVETEKGKVPVTATSDNIAAVKVDGVTATDAATTLTLKAVDEGVATVYVNAGDDTIEIEVTVSSEVAQAIQDGINTGAATTFETTYAATEGIGIGAETLAYNGGADTPFAKAKAFVTAYDKLDAAVVAKLDAGTTTAYTALKAKVAELEALEAAKIEAAKITNELTFDVADADKADAAKVTAAAVEAAQALVADGYTVTAEEGTISEDNSNKLTITFKVSKDGKEASTGELTLTFGIETPEGEV